MARIDETVKVMMLKGERGAGIQKIDKTASSGLMDTYTATFSDGGTSNFYVSNGEKGEKGDKGDKGDAGITVPMAGLFSLGVDSDGNLTAYYNDAGTAPEFEYDKTTGNIYYIIEEG